MKRFNIVNIKGAGRRQRFFDQILDIGTSDDNDRFFPAFMGASLAKRFNPDFNVIRQLLSKNNANIWFFCVPKTKWGARMQTRLARSGTVTKIPLSKNVMDALSHNRGLRKPALNSACKVLIILDKNPSALNSDNMRYSHKSSQPIVLGELFLQVVRQKQQARKVTRGGI